MSSYWSAGTFRLAVMCQKFQSNGQYSAAFNTYESKIICKMSSLDNGWTLPSPAAARHGGTSNGERWERESGTEPTRTGCCLSSSSLVMVGTLEGVSIGRAGQQCWQNHLTHRATCRGRNVSTFLFWNDTVLKHPEPRTQRKMRHVCALEGFLNSTQHADGIPSCGFFLQLSQAVDGFNVKAGPILC